MANELLQALADLEPAEPVRWPDPGDLRAKVMAHGLLASPAATRQYIEGLKLALDRADTLDELVSELYGAGAYLGGHGAGEAAGLLWSLADTIRASLNEEGAES